MTTNPMTPHGAVPAYVPDHLAGKVWDFRNEGGGNVSFQHPEAVVGSSPADMRVTMSADEYKRNFDPVTRVSNLQDSAEQGYAPMHRRPRTAARQMNDTIADGINRAVEWGTSSQGKAVGTAGLLSALAGGIGGYAWGRSNYDEHPVRKALMLALLAGGIGAAGTAWTQNRHNRREDWLSKKGSFMDPTQFVISAINSDPSISASDRTLLFRALASASSYDQNALSNLIRTTAGVGAGVLAMRFLGAKGLLPMAVGGILGGLIGSSLGSGSRRNAFGQIKLDYI